MRAIVYTETGDPEVLELVERPDPTPGSGEVVVRVARSGVNPTDWKSRRGNGPGQAPAFPEVVPDQDGSGTIVAAGAGVDPARVGQRVWLWEAAWAGGNGTAQELVTIPERQAVPLPEGASFDLGASVGIPGMTAHRCLTVAEGGPNVLGPGSLDGRTVLVQGGAGAVGHAAIELASWSGATVITTVSSPDKARLAATAGADYVVNYRVEDAAAAIRGVAPDGVDIIVEVAAAANAELDPKVIGANGVVSAYAAGPESLKIVIRTAMTGNTRYQFVLVYSMPDEAKEAAVRGVSAAVEAGIMRVGELAGLPLHHFPLEATADAHAAVEDGAVGKVLIDVAD